MNTYRNQIIEVIIKTPLHKKGTMNDLLLQNQLKALYIADRYGKNLALPGALKFAQNIAERAKCPSGIKEAIKLAVKDTVSEKDVEKAIEIVTEISLSKLMQSWVSKIFKPTFLLKYQKHLLNEKIKNVHLTIKNNGKSKNKNLKLAL